MEDVVCAAVELYCVIRRAVSNILAEMECLYLVSGPVPLIVLSCCLLSECGGVLNNPAGGIFTSPGYLVSNYSSNLNCEWLIQNPRHINSSIVVLIEDLHIENHQICESDFLQFRLGESHTESAGSRMHRRK